MVSHAPHNGAGPERWAEAALGIIRPPARRLIRGDHGRRRVPGCSGRRPRRWWARRCFSPRPQRLELLARRATQLAGSPRRLRLHHRASTIAMILDRWDEKAARPVIRTTMASCLEQIEANREKNSGVNVDEVLINYMAAFTLIRMADGDRLALEEYAAWAQSPARRSCSTGPSRASNRCGGSPTTRRSARPPGCSTTRDRRGCRCSATRGTAPTSSSNIAGSTPRRWSSRPDSATGLLEGMANKARIGTVRHDRGLALLYRTPNGWEEGFACRQEDADSLELGMERPFRVCDYLAWQVSSIEGSPRCELYWPEDRRDRAVQACAAFLKRYRERFTGDPFVGNSPDERRAHLAFPIATRPATLDDVRAAGRSSRSKGRERSAWRRSRPCRSGRVGSPSRIRRSTSGKPTGRSPAGSIRTAGSGRPRRSARGTAGSVPTGSSARTRSREPPPPRSSWPGIASCGGPSPAAWTRGSSPWTRRSRATNRAGRSS